MKNEKNIIADATKTAYPFGFHSAIATDRIQPGLDEITIRQIAKRRNEPSWLLEWRLSAYQKWKIMREPTWANLHYPNIDFQKMSYYAAPKRRPQLSSLEEVDPVLRETFAKLGIPVFEQERLSGVAIDAVVDSVSVATSVDETLEKLGIIFCSLGEAVHRYPELVKKYLGTVVPKDDNFFAALNATVMSDGTFVYVPKNIHCPIELSTYFRMNEANTGQFERTLIIAEAGSYVSYLEGCTAPRREENQLHAAVVEIVALDNAEVRYATVQNWYPGDEHGKGGIYNFVTKRGRCLGRNAKIAWTQVETGASITWKYPSVILEGDNSKGAFYSVAVTTAHQQADTGTKMIHLGRHTKSTVIAKSIAAGESRNTYRGLVKVGKGGDGVHNFSQCDSLLIGGKSSAYTFPTLESRNAKATIQHEATTSKIGDDQLFYLTQRGIRTEEAVGLIVNGYCREIMGRLPMEFAVEAKKLLSLTLAGAVG
ncbi:Fe-S cluster assembly protein SufB [Candidatus Uhrbacteria bacterium CG10_big_fil_rev_8_21_14_0_10_48_11]|uniref:Fe-S cluster assembly protein SufB n=1 Tax=Candidatus Uhrbacteria bacterium CG10_big_fil_rev_8_21_14_0_10_48_11 TaxID=1975037 RepID=A0A2M8LF70_9BACT|nr:MAG: Fe-S cluster assembly protein SufB [Candidatus Uhrbacteria bacterium CG10_big_fil_rev_8_21_14_0_10_48_11]